jgi:hypothetical protein
VPRPQCRSRNPNKTSGRPKNEAIQASPRTFHVYQNNGNDAVIGSSAQRIIRRNLASESSLSSYR